MSNENIFLALSKYNSAKDENYLTESFVYLLNSLLQRDRDIGIAVLNELLVKDNDFSFDTDEYISISTQETTEQGRPDIKVSSPDKLIYVEVKHDSTLGHRQIERYKAALNQSLAIIKHVILLTRFAVDFNEQQEKPYKHIRWFEVYKCLDNTKVQDSISKYLIESFKNLLEVKRMSIQKVGWEYINGLPALNSLIDMIEVAIQAASLKVHQKRAAWDSKAFWLEKKEFWCGVYYDDSQEVIFEIANKNKFNLSLVDNTRYPVEKEKKTISFVLKLDDIYFFSLDKDKQLEEISKFIKKSYDDAQKMRVK